MAEAILSTGILILVLAAVVGAIAYGVVTLTRRRRDFAEIDHGIGTVRRLYFYVVSFVALLMAANGVVLVATSILDAIFGDVVLSSSDIKLAAGLSLTIVGLPLWALHWRIVRKQVRDLPAETRSVVRKAYIYIVLAVALSLLAWAMVGLVQWAFRLSSFTGYPWGAVVVWGIVWASHWRLETQEGQPTPETRAVRRLYIYLVAIGTLAVAASGIGQIIHVVLREAYDNMTSQFVLAQPALWAEPTREALARTLVAVPLWAAHWLYFARRDYESTLRQLYLYSFAIFGSIVTVLTALGIMLYGVLVWTIGVPEEEVAAVYFGFLPGALASLIVGGGILAYHWLAAEWEAEAYVLEPQVARKAYPYALAGLGLATLAMGIYSLVVSAIVVLTESDRVELAGEDVWRNAMAMGITLCALGAPLWGYFWVGIQRRVSAVGVVERTGLPRRIFIFATLGVGMLVLLASVSGLVFVFFRELLDGDLSQVLGDAKVSIGFIVAVAIFLPYYWMVYRTDRREAPAAAEEEKPKVRKAVTVLVSEAGMGFVRELEAVLGYRVNPLHWADTDTTVPELAESGFQELAQSISDASGPNVLLVADGAKVRVLSYQ